jgi:hypothetical protein
MASYKEKYLKIYPGLNAAKVIGVVITSSPFFRPIAFNARWLWQGMNLQK